MLWIVSVHHRWSEKVSFLGTVPKIPCTREHSLDCSKSLGFCIYRMTFEIYLILTLIMSFKRYSSMITSKRRGQFLAVATVNKILMKSLYNPSKKFSLKITRDKRKNSMKLVRRICLNIKTPYPRWSLPLFLLLEYSNK